MIFSGDNALDTAIVKGALVILSSCTAIGCLVWLAAKIGVTKSGNITHRS